MYLQSLLERSYEVINSTNLMKHTEIHSKYHSSQELCYIIIIMTTTAIYPPSDYEGSIHESNLHHLIIGVV